MQTSFPGRSTRKPSHLPEKAFRECQTNSQTPGTTCRLAESEKMTSKAVTVSCATRMESHRQISKCYVEICDVASGWPGTKPYWAHGADPDPASAPRPPGSCPVAFSRASGLLAACQISYLCMESSPFLRHSGHRTAAQCHVTVTIPVGTPCPSTATSGFVAFCVFFCCCRAESNGISHTGSCRRFSNCWICAFDEPLFAGFLLLWMCCLF